MSEETTQNTTDMAQPKLAIVRIYLKDASFEAPNTPEIFKEDWAPDIKLQLNTNVNQLEADTYEIVLSVTVTAKQGDTTGFLVEIQQAGIFRISGFEQDQARGLLRSYCPETLFPYAREAISDLVVKGSFPQLLLAPINFDALYEQQVATANTQQSSDE